jgi:HK97 family phage major capsid protein
VDLEIKSVLENISSTVQQFKAQHSQLQAQVDSIDKQLAGSVGRGGIEAKSIAEEIFENPEFKRLGEMGGRGRAAIKILDFHKKSLTATGAGFTTSGVMAIDRVPGIVGTQFRQLRIRDLLRSQPTELAAVDYVKVNSFTNNASPQVEASAKQESTLTLASVSAQIRTLAHYVRASKQILMDLPGLTDTVNSHLIYGLKLKEEDQLLAADGTGQNLLGLIPQATNFDTSLLPSTYNRLDVIATAIRQAERSDYAVDTIVLHTDDFWGLALTKSSQGEYLFGDPSAATIPRLWGRPIAVTNSISSGTFLVGSSMTALIRDRQDVIVEVSENVGDDFLSNMICLRCEERLALQVMRPAAWIYGSMTTSPAS